MNAAGEVYVTGYYKDQYRMKSTGLIAKWSPDLQRQLFSMHIGLVGDFDVGIAVRDTVPPFVVPPLVKIVLGAIGAAAVAHWVARRSAPDQRRARSTAGGKRD